MLLFRALASGSSGNAYLLRTEAVTLLFEAGLPLPRLQQVIAGESLSPQAVSGVFISHEHRDHCAGARDLAELYGTRLWANSDVLRAAGLHGLEQSCVLDVAKPILVGNVEVTSFPVAHDSVSPVGFLIRTEGKTIVLATDLGEASTDIADMVGLADLVVLEANHDTEMLQRSRYPYHLRRRISGPKGHLSNTQTASILSRSVQREDVEVWLAHLSRNNNTPQLASSTVRRALKAIGLANLPVGVALRDRPSLRWNGLGRPRQLSLFGAEAG